jgi:hypothetical protein
MKKRNYSLALFLISIPSFNNGFIETKRNIDGKYQSTEIEEKWSIKKRWWQDFDHTTLQV